MNWLRGDFIFSLVVPLDTLKETYLSKVDVNSEAAHNFNAFFQICSAHLAQSYSLKAENFVNQISKINSGG